MAREKLTSSLEKVMSAFERKDEIIERGKQFRESEAFKSLESQDQQTFENYWMAVAGGALKKNTPQWKEQLADFEQFLDTLDLVEA